MKFLLAVILIAALAGASDARTVTVAVPSQSMAQIALYGGQEKGYYREEGLDVELILMTAPVANLALIGGNVDFTTVPAAALNAALRGAPLRIIFNTFHKPMHWLYSRPQVREMKDLKGKRIGVDGLGGAMELLVQEILQRQGLKNEKDIHILGLGVQSNRYTALQTGAADAVILTFPFNFTAQQAGFRELVSFMKQDDMVQLAGAIVTREPLSDPSLVERFIRGTLKGLLYARANRAGAGSILARRIKINDELALRIYDLAHPGMSTDGTLQEELQQKELEQNLRRIGSKESPPVGKFFDFSLARKARAELDQMKWKPGP
jgi:ABC-type nitrate/sulfonate/bicarbonate transport system substrate-binding protein